MENVHSDMMFLLFIKGYKIKLEIITSVLQIYIQQNEKRNIFRNKKQVAGKCSLLNQPINFRRLYKPKPEQAS